MSASDSSSAPSPPQEGTEARNAYEAFREASEGDQVLFGGRREPLTVTGVTEENDRYRLELAGPRGGTVEVYEEYVPGAGVPAYRSGRGEDATNLRIVEAASDGSDPGGQASETPMREEGDGMSSRQGRMAAGTLEEDDMVVGEDVGQPWPSPPDSAKREDLDDEVYDTTGDPMSDARDLFEGTVEGGPVRDTSAHPVDEFGTYTFVDELLQFGQDVPRSVNNWVLVEYGVIEDANSRRMAWVDAEANELLVLGAVRQPDDEQPRWFVWHVRNPKEADARDPAVSTRDPYEALDTVSDVLYGDADEVDISIQEGPDGELTIVDNLDDEAFADMVMDKLAGIKQLPGKAAGAIPRTDYGIQYPGGVTGWARDTSDNVLEYFNENKQDFGKLVKFGLVYSAVAASRRVASAGIGPIIEEDKLGVYVDSKYVADSVDDVPIPVPFANRALSLFEDNRSSTEAGGFDIDTELYINPQNFNFGAGPVTEAGLSYERLVDVADVLNLDTLELNIPGAAAIRSLRVAEDEEGNVKVVRSEEELGGGSSRSRRNKSGRSNPSGGGSQSVAESMSRNRESDPTDATHRTSGGKPTSDHKRFVRQAIINNNDPDAIYAEVNALAAMYIEEALDDAGVDFEAAGSGRIGEILGKEWRKHIGDAVENYYNSPSAVSSSSYIEDILVGYHENGMSFQDAAAENLGEYMGGIPSPSGASDDGGSDSGGSDGDSGGDADGSDGPSDEEVEEATEEMVEQASEEGASTLADIAQETQSNLDERMDEAAVSGIGPDGDVVASREGTKKVATVLNEKSPSNFTADEWVLMAAWAESAEKSTIRKRIREQSREQGMGVLTRDDYTDDEVRDGEMTEDMFGGEE